MNSQCEKLFVAAIDFGTTYSGYAFSATSDCCKVLTSNWQGGGKLVSVKTPTAILLDEDTKCVAFGYDAEDQYMDLARDEEHESYYFFHRFKMMLHSEKVLNRKTICKDATGKELPAKTVFSRSIEFFKDSLMLQLQNSFPSIVLSDVDFVLTVPAIWDDRSKQFMREAAVEAGLDKKCLRIALEPEAASIYSQYTPDDDANNMTECLGVVDQGTKYMVLDLGGGTADITVHEKAADGSLEELRGASGGPWGGKKVDDEFEHFLSEIIGEENMNTFKTKNLEDYIDLMRNYESRKRHIKDGQGNIHLSVPLSFITLVKQDKNLKGLDKAIRNSKNAGKVSFENHKLKFEKTVFMEFFQNTISAILEHLETIFKEESVKTVDIILMVGGFSDCLLVQKAVKEKFSRKKVIVPVDAGIAVLKGAVYYGHVPNIISRRSARYTYGIQSWPEYNPLKHKDEKKIKLGDSLRCRDVFFKYVSKGQRITPGFRKSQIFQVLKPEENTLQCAIYISDKPDPMYIDEPGCRLLGVLTIPLPDIRRGTSMELEETMIFGETELRIQARDIYTNQFQEVIFDLLADEDSNDS